MTILFFTAAWCNICKAMYPTWGRIVTNNTTLSYEIVDCSKSIERAKQYNASSLPTFIAIDEIGTPIDRKQGFLTEATFQNWVDSLK